MKNFFSIFTTLFLFIFTLQLAMSQPAKYDFPFQDPALPMAQRVDDLVSRMTLQEKVSQMNNEAKAIDRFGIPAYNWWNECLHGVANQSNVTVFPQSIGLGATWDTDLVFKVASATSDEARALHNQALSKGHTNPGLTYWSPNINIFRDPRWGRGQETYGEDPYLTSRLGVSFVKGLQGNDPKYLKLVSTPKHFAVHSGPDPMRHRFNAVIDNKNLFETYLPHFEAVVREGHAQSVMCAYNRVNGEPCCSNPILQESILRDLWGFAGYIVSDCGAIDNIFRDHKVVETPEQAAARAISNGCDLACGNTYEALVKAVEQGMVSEDTITRSLRRLLTARMKLGMFDPPEMVPYSKLSTNIIDSNENRKLALDAARESIVLLKSQNNILPLKKNIKTIAVIGPNADDPEVLYGNYNGTPSHAVTPLLGIMNKVSKNTKVIYAKGCDLLGWASLDPVPSDALRVPQIESSFSGLQAEYFNNSELKGEPVLIRRDSNVFFNWDNASPDPKIVKDDFSIRWSGKLVPPVSGKYTLGTISDDGIRVKLDGKIIIEHWNEHGPITDTVNIDLEKDKAYDLVIEYCEYRGEAVAKFLWSVPDTEGRHKQEAIDAAKKADVTVMVLGIAAKKVEDEFRDRTFIDLPEVQEELLKAVCALGKPVILVLESGSALSVNWEQENIPAIVQAWYPGEEGGTAIADVLFGDYNPGGRLPVTVYKSLDQVPPFEDYDMTKGRTYKYFTGTPLYPFGYGLSYTLFKYSNLSISPKTINTDKKITVSVNVKNTGKKAGDEIVQLYLSHENTTINNIPVPQRELQGFKRVFLKPGHQKKVSFTLTSKQYSYVNQDGNRQISHEKIKVFVGGGQPGFEHLNGNKFSSPLMGKFTIQKEFAINKEWKAFQVGLNI